MLDCIFTIFNNMFRYQYKKKELYNIVEFFIDNNNSKNKKLYITLDDFQKILNYNENIHLIYMDKNNIIHCKHREFINNENVNVIVNESNINENINENEINKDLNELDTPLIESEKIERHEQSVTGVLEDEPFHSSGTRDESMSEAGHMSEAEQGPLLLNITIINGEIVLYNESNEEIIYENLCNK